MDVDEENPIIKSHFLQRDEKEEYYFGKNNSTIHLNPNFFKYLPYNEANKAETFEWIQSAVPDYIVLFGSSIIKDHLLSYYNENIVNVHLGLSPYYRDSGTNYWPLVNNQPECVGATIHFSASAIDAGEILTQVKPNVSTDDGCHDIGCKVIIAGSHATLKVITALERKQLKAVSRGVADMYIEQETLPPILF